MRVDLNLLTVFDAIMAEHSLTRAAKRLDKTQSAISHSLTRLRELTGDELFERTGRGVRPTLRALEMEKEVRRALSIMHGVLQGSSDFEPATENRTFLIDIPAGFDWVIAPRLAARLADMPGITLRISNSRAADLLTELRYRETLLALDYAPMKADGYMSDTLFDSEIVLIARLDHPRLKNGPTHDDLKTLGQVGIGWPGMLAANHPIDQRIEEADLARPVKLWVPTLSTMIATIQSTDLVAYCADVTARAFATSQKIAIHRLPVELARLPMVMVWHESVDNDAGHRWLREIVREICRVL